MPGHAANRIKTDAAEISQVYFTEKSGEYATSLDAGRRAIQQRRRHPLRCWQVRARARSSLFDKSITRLPTSGRPARVRAHEQSSGDSLLKASIRRGEIGAGRIVPAVITKARSRRRQPRMRAAHIPAKPRDSGRQLLACCCRENHHIHPLSNLHRKSPIGTTIL